MCFIASPEFVSSGRGESKHAAHRVRNHQFFICANDANRGPAGVRGNHPRSLRVVRLIVFRVPSGNSSVQAVAHGGGSVAHKVDEAALDVGVDQLDVDVVAHVKTLEPALQPAFGRRLEEPDPRAFIRCAGDDGVE